MDFPKTVVTRSPYMPYPIYLQGNISSPSIVAVLQGIRGYRVLPGYCITWGLTYLVLKSHRGSEAQVPDPNPGPRVRTVTSAASLLNGWGMRIPGAGHSLKPILGNRTARAEASDSSSWQMKARVCPKTLHQSLHHQRWGCARGFRV